MLQNNLILQTLKTQIRDIKYISLKDIIVTTYEKQDWERGQRVWGVRTITFPFPFPSFWVFKLSPKIYYFLVFKNDFEYMFNIN